MDEEHPCIIQAMYIRSQSDTVFPCFSATIRGAYDMRRIECLFRVFAAYYAFLVVGSDN